MFETGAFLLATLLTIPNGFGVNIHFTGNPQDLDLIAEAGFRFIRMDFVWGAVEREKGVYNFENTGYDALTEGCLSRGIKPLYILDYSNKLYEENNSVRTAEGRSAFAKFAETAVKRYEGKDILWEIWNEPNLNHFWNPQPSVDDYCELVKETSSRVKKSVPSAIIVAPATSGIPMEWLEGCFKKGLLDWIDALTVHPYRAQNPETVIGDYAKLRELISKYTKKNIPIISGEWGYSNINWDKNRITEETQAQYLVRMFLINHYQGIPVNIWYDWKNDGTDPNEREHHFGTMTHDLKPKKAYLAVKALSKVLNGYSITERIDLGDNNDFALKLTNGKDSAIALWTTKDDHEVKVNIGKNNGILIDMYDEKRQAWNGEKILLSQSPQYLMITDKR
ncbi:MAG: cellulase family glycosylhydrolase [Candidatus Poribacteria bacterium]